MYTVYIIYILYIYYIYIWKLRGIWVVSWEMVAIGFWAWLQIHSG